MLVAEDTLAQLLLQLDAQLLLRNRLARDGALRIRVAALEELITQLQEEIRDHCQRTRIPIPRSCCHPDDRR